MKKILLSSFFCLLLSFSALAQTSYRNGPAEEDVKKRDALEADPAVQLLEYGRRKNFADAEKADKAKQEAIRLRLLAYEAFRDGDKTVKLKQTGSTIEGTKVASYLIIENGKAQYIADYTRDKFGGWKFSVYDCGKLLIGTYGYVESKRAMIFTPVEKIEDLNGEIPYFECHAENRQFVF